MPKRAFLPFFVAAIFFFLASSEISAATFTVNSTADAVDANPGNGVCLTAGGVCTLRAAIQEANALAGADIITLPAGTYILTIAGSGENLAATGDLDINDDLTINGAGAATTIIDGGALDRVFDVRLSTTSTFNDITVKNGLLNATAGGVGININGLATLTLNRVIISNNVGSGNDGGGIMNNGTLTMTDVVLKNNSQQNGAGMENSGLLTATNVTISGNTGDNAGFYQVGNTASKLTNVTISGNTGNFVGGAIFYAGISLVNVTIANNTGGSFDAGGIENFAGASLTFKNVLLSQNTGGSGNCKNSLTSQGGNLSTDTSCAGSFTASTDKNNLEAKIFGLATNNNAFTQTHALNWGSPAIDAGVSAGCPSTDQTGTSRPQDGNNDGITACDIGAYEYVYTNVPAAPNPIPESQYKNCLPGWKFCSNGGADYKGLDQYVFGDGPAGNTMAFITKTSSKIGLYVSISLKTNDNILASKDYIPFPWAKGFNTTSEIYDFKAVSSFNGYPVPELDQPTLVIIPYDPKKLPKNVSPKSLKIAWYNKDKKTWEPVTNPVVIDVLRNNAATTTTHFSLMAVVYPRTLASVLGNFLSFLGLYQL